VLRLGTRTSKPRWALVAFSTILAIGIVLAPAASGGTGYRSQVLRMVNATRDHRGLHTLRIDASLSRDAMRHTRRMIADDAIYDPRNLSRILRDEPWNNVGASVVGCADSLRELHRAFMHHAEHRLILLDPQLSRIGIGVIEDDSANACGRHWFWTTELFYG
jgi:uncharacterized protein YkwD